MKLTNAIRDVFINAVMADVPAVDYETKIRDAVNKAAHAALPPAIKKLLADEKTAIYVRKDSAQLGGGYNPGLPEGRVISFSQLHAAPGTLYKIAVAAAEPFIKAWTQQHEQHKELRAKLRAVANHCTTRAQLVEAFPEFERYLPADDKSATRNLPALANVAADFVKAGWPKSGKKVAA